ncbi:MAG: hypothetical protein IPK73_29670 [Candidatus Obscuribacter sp.]|nr:hypothetical protein [Candidatus Obscuribacter sp.]
MNTNASTCYAGHQGNAPVIPSLLASPLLQTGIDFGLGERRGNDGEKQVQPWAKNGTCNGPCTRNDLLAKVFGEE